MALKIHTMCSGCGMYYAWLGLPSSHFKCPKCRTIVTLCIRELDEIFEIEEKIDHELLEKAIEMELSKSS